MRRKRGLNLFLAMLTATLAGFLLISVANASSANISYSYHSNSPLQNGSLVSLDLNQNNYVTPANSSNGAHLVGVATASNDSRIAVGAAPGAVQVATSGTASVLVSTLGGNVNVGDQVGVSPFNGIGIKALPGSRVIGVAQTSFNSSTPGAVTEQATDKNGKSSSIQVGYAKVDIAIATNATVLTAGNINSLQKFVKSLTGRTVPTVRVIISMVIAIVAIVALITLLYGAIYSSIVSVGRNPLARYSIFRALGSVLGMAALTAVVSGLTIFLLLR